MIVEQANISSSFDAIYAEVISEALGLADAPTYYVPPIIEEIEDILFMYDALKHGWLVTASDSIALADSALNVLAVLISEWITLIDTESNNWNGMETVPDAINLFDVAQQHKIFLDSISEGLGLADSSTYVLTVAVLEYLGFNDLAAAMLSFTQTATDSLTLNDSSFCGFNESVESLLQAVDSVSVIAALVSSIQEILSLADSASPINNIKMEADESLVLVESLSSQGNLYSVVYDTLGLNVEIELDGEIWECYALNTPAFLPSMYSGFNFNSYCCFENRAFGANEDGIFELTGDTDAGEKIHTGVVLSATYFNIPNQKRFRRAYLGITGEAPVMIFETAEGQRLIYKVDTQGKVVASHDLKSKKWKLSIADFDSLAHMKLIPIILTR